jgi:hypothetical protein
MWDPSVLKLQSLDMEMGWHEHTQEACLHEQVQASTHRFVDHVNALVISCFKEMHATSTTGLLFDFSTKNTNRINLITLKIRL